MEFEGHIPVFGPCGQEEDLLAFGVEGAQREPPERQNTGVRRLMVRFDGAPGPCAVTILLTSGSESEPPAAVEVRSLSDW